MPTNRAGDRTATQAPSAAPQPEGTITQALPADGDPPNASTLNQAWKVCADFIDWLFKPQAKSGAWAGPIVRFRSALGHARGAIDHFGFPTGRIVQWDESWPMLAATQGVPVSGTWIADLLNQAAIPNSAAVVGYLAGNVADNFVYYLEKEFSNGAADVSSLKTALYNAGQRFNDAIVAGMGGVRLPVGPWFVAGSRTLGSGSPSWGVLPPDASATRRHRYLTLDAADGANDYVHVYRYGQSRWDDDLTAVLEWEAYVSAANIPNRHCLVGFSNEGLVPGVNSQDYGVFDLGPSGNWFYSVSSAGSPASTDTGVAATVGWTRFRVEFVGANVADDNTRAMRFYINGALVGTATAHVPTNASTASISACISMVSTGGASGASFPLRVGPMRFRSNLYGADVL